MARRRMIDPEFWLDEDLAKLSAHARLLYIGLWNICDDNYATFPEKIGWLKIQIFPYEEVDIKKLLQELSGSGRILRFDSKGEKFYFIKNFFKYQRVEKPSLPKYPKYLVLLPDYSPTTPAKVSKLSKLSKVSKGEPNLKKLREQWGKKI